MFRLDAEWDESSHPRGKDGRFGEGKSAASDAYHQAIHEGADHDQAHEEAVEAAKGEGATQEEAEAHANELQQEYRSSETGLDDEGKPSVGLVISGYEIAKDPSKENCEIKNGEGQTVGILKQIRGGDWYVDGGSEEKQNYNSMTGKSYRSYIGNGSGIFGQGQTPAIAIQKYSQARENIENEFFTRKENAEELSQKANSYSGKSERAEARLHSEAAKEYVWLKTIANQLGRTHEAEENEQRQGFHENRKKLLLSNFLPK